MSYVSVAIFCGLATIVGIAIPGTAKAAVALAAFGCGLNTAIAIIEWRRP